MLMLVMNETIDQSANSAYLCGHVLKSTFDFDIENQRKKERAWKDQVKKESVEVGMSIKDAFC